MSALDAKKIPLWSAAAMAVIAGLLATRTAPAGASVVTETFNYDGSYAPDSASPPPGQTTWTKYAPVAQTTITPNSPSAGLAAFVDATDSSRLSIYKLYSDAAFKAAPAGYEWDYSFRMRFDSMTGGNILFGVRDEGNTSTGKTVMLGLDVTVNPSFPGALRFYNNAGGNVQLLNGSDFRDGKSHEFRVRKFLDPADSLMKVQVFIDGVAEGTPLLYSSMPTTGAATNGFGYFTPTSGQSTVIVDDVHFGAPAPVTQYLAAFNGSYAPNSSTPPLTQTTWSVADTSGTGDLTPNSPTPGLMRLYDNDGGRLSFYDKFEESLRYYEWSYRTRLKLDSLSGPPIFIGVRDEGGDGKMIMLGWNSSNGSLGFYNNDNTVQSLVGSTNFVNDGQYHTYRVDKYLDGLEWKVQAYVDDVAQLATPLLYSSFRNDVDALNGIGYFSSSPGFSDLTLDYLVLSTGAYYVPEPRSAVLAGLGAVGLALLGLRRRRK